MKAGRSNVGELAMINITLGLVHCLYSLGFNFGPQLWSSGPGSHHWCWLFTCLLSCDISCFWL